MVMENLGILALVVSAILMALVAFEMACDRVEARGAEGEDLVPLTLAPPEEQPGTGPTSIFWEEEESHDPVSIHGYWLFGQEMLRCCRTDGREKS